ncbi:hypothetical protein AGMMS50262_23550 [Bacteroidia bacterium]|nr:hypothetical protein AGMMS50262_23550 [Bacteroidia bacterium]
MKTLQYLFILIVCVSFTNCGNDLMIDQISEENTEQQGIATEEAEDSINMSYEEPDSAYLAYIEPLQ